MIRRFGQEHGLSEVFCLDRISLKLHKHFEVKSWKCLRWFSSRQDLITFDFAAKCADHKLALSFEVWTCLNFLNIFKGSSSVTYKKMWFWTFNHLECFFTCILARMFLSHPKARRWTWRRNWGFPLSGCKKDFRRWFIWPMRTEVSFVSWMT